MKEPTMDGIIQGLSEWCEKQTARGWDMPPVLATLYRDGQRYKLQAWNIPAEWWAFVGQPSKLLYALAQAEPVDLTPGVVGLAVSTEGWGFPDEHPHEGDCEGTSCPYWQWVESGKLVQDHPDGQEARTVLAIVAGGRRILVSQARGQEPKVLHDGAASVVDGSLHEALSTLMASLLR